MTRSTVSCSTMASRSARLPMTGTAGTAPAVAPRLAVVEEPDELDAVLGVARRSWPPGCARPRRRR